MTAAPYLRGSKWRRARFGRRRVDVQWQRDSNQRAAAVRRLGANGPVMQRDNLAANGEPQARSAGAGARRPRLDEFVEDRLAFVVGDSRTVVLEEDFRGCYAG